MFICLSKYHMKVPRPILLRCYYYFLQFLVSAYLPVSQATTLCLEPVIVLCFYRISIYYFYWMFHFNPHWGYSYRRNNYKQMLIWFNVGTAEIFVPNTLPDSFRTYYITNDGLFKLLLTTCICDSFCNKRNYSYYHIVIQNKFY